jgi:hypothetical protein
METFVKVLGFSLAFMFLLLLSYEKGKKYFNSTVESLEVQQDLTSPTVILLFFGSLSIAIVIAYISLLNYFGVLFVIESFEMLALNLIALIMFFLLSFFLLLGWDIIKILGIAAQYLMLQDIQNGRKPKFLRSMRFVFKRIRIAWNILTVFITLDLSCKTLSKERTTYKNLIFPIKVWTTCLAVCKDENIIYSLKQSFSYFKNKKFETFYSSNLAAFFLPMMIIPIGLSLGIIISNLEYFSVSSCIHNNCVLMIFFFLVFMALGFFLAYSISISLESAYYSKILNDIEQEKIPELVGSKPDENINTIEKKVYERLSKTEGNFWDVFRVF